MRTPAILPLLASLITAALLPAMEDAGLGHIEIPPLGPSLVFRETPAFLHSPAQAPGGVRLNVALNWLNYWLLAVQSDIPYEPGADPETFPFRYGSFLVDMEVLSATLRAEWQVSGRWRLDAALPVYAVGGGVLDGFIEGFHNAFSIDNHHREWRPRDRAGIFYIRRDGTLLRMEGGDLEGGHWGNAVAGAAFSLWDGRTSASLRLSVKAPTASLEFFGSNGWDGSLQWTWAWCRGVVCGYHAAGYTRHGSPGDGEMDLVMDRLSLMSAFEMRLSPRNSLLLQALWTTPYADYPAIDDPVFEVTLGLKKRLRNAILEAAFIENLLFYDNSPDIGFHFAWTWPAP